MSEILCPSNNPTDKNHMDLNLATLEAMPVL
jgi:hypothetical protein